MPNTFGVIDLFAGPGGLGEGFASLDEGGHSPFSIEISIEKETSAHQTLRLRAFLRRYRSMQGRLPPEFINLHAGQVDGVDWEAVDADSWRHASREARCVELGAAGAAEAIDRAIANVRRKCDDAVLIGGPPCQAYSLVGRARVKGKLGYVPEKDERHYLFREYIRVLDRLRPAAFVMENVKGMLSSTVESRLVFEMLMDDLASLGKGYGNHYELRAIRIDDGRATLQQAAQPQDFVARAEKFGVPQRRHRVIIVGIRADLASAIDGAIIEVPETFHTLDDALGNLPALRSGISRGLDSPATWRQEVLAAAQLLVSIHSSNRERPLAKAFKSVATGISGAASLPRGSTQLPEGYATRARGLLAWLECSELKAIAQHGARAHMPTDLGRYLFAAVFGATRGYSPKAVDFPSALSPNHRNWHTGVFNDRFRVQLSSEPSTTVTSHISKDGHYFIHPDPMQCRSLTVREAARLQTFPDDYLFLGNRTQQYVQIGNAVPPYLARQIASLLARCLSGSATSSSRQSARLLSEAAGCVS